jgi:hypothetical protein
LGYSKTRGDLKMGILSKNRIIVLVISTIIALIGLILLLGAVDRGSVAAGNYMRTKMGGSMDTNQYLIVFESYIKTYRWTGSILLFIGLLFVLRNIEKIDFIIIKKPESEEID